MNIKEGLDKVFLKLPTAGYSLLRGTLGKAYRSQSILGKANRERANLRSFREFLVRISKTNPNPRFVKVGANDGLTGDPCSDLLLADERWSGVLIEPVPFIFARLQKNFRDRGRFSLEQIAVGPAGNGATFHYIEPSAKLTHPDLPDWFDQIGSFDPSHISKHFGTRLDAFVRKLPIRSEPLSEIFVRHQIASLELLHVDTEGFDLKVLSTLDFSRVRPKCIFIEHKHLDASDRRTLLGLLKAQNYRIRDCGGDYFAFLGK
jgi:FkbM family methyltransferase